MTEERKMQERRRDRSKMKRKRVIEMEERKKNWRRNGKKKDEGKREIEGWRQVGRVKVNRGMEEKRAKWKKGRGKENVRG